MPVPREDGDNAGIPPAMRTNQYFNSLTAILLIPTSQRAAKTVTYSTLDNFKPSQTQIKLYTCYSGNVSLYFPSIFHRLASLSLQAFKKAMTGSDFFE